MKKLLLLITIFTLNTHHSNSQWVQQTVPVSKPITGIKFIDSLKGWACTNRGTPADTGYILYTSNGGTNWLVQLAAYNINFTDIEIIDNLNGNVSAYDNNIGLAKLFKTTNGGLNWFSITMIPNLFIGDMQFLNKDSAWESGGIVGPDVRTTTNGGLNWIVRTNGIAAQTQRIFFLNYNTGFCGANNFLYKTTNAGMNWIQVGFFVEQINSIFFKNINTGWLGCTNRKIKFTSNGGLNWIEQSNPLIFGTINSLIMINDSLGYAGGRSLYIYKTTNSGNSWGYQIDSSGSYRISFIDTIKGWSGDFGISKTTNGGGPVYYLGFTPEGTNIPKDFRLYQNYPNPFNPFTTIKLDISESSVIKLYISDILGRLHYEVINQFLVPGEYEFNWDSRVYSSGVYFYTLISDKFTETKKMLLVK